VGIVARQAGVLRLNAPETGFLQIILINERFNETHGIFSTDVIINCYRQKAPSPQYACSKVVDFSSTM
jgi:hypothetical protein